MALNRWVRTASGNLVARGAFHAPVAVFSLTTSSPRPTNAGAENTWITIDLRDGAHWNGVNPEIPHVASVKAIVIHGVVIITQGQAVGIADYLAAFRSANPEDTFNFGNYQIQAVTTEAGDGVRQNASLTIPVWDGKFQFRWNRTGAGGNWDCGINAKIYEVIY